MHAAFEPARPLFDKMPKKYRLDSSDAKSVTALHFAHNKDYNFQKPIGDTDIFMVDDIGTSVNYSCYEK